MARTRCPQLGLAPPAPHTRTAHQPLPCCRHPHVLCGTTSSFTHQCTPATLRHARPCSTQLCLPHPPPLAAILYVRVCSMSSATRCSPTRSLCAVRVSAAEGAVAVPGRQADRQAGGGSTLLPRAGTTLAMAAAASACAHSRGSCSPGLCITAPGAAAATPVVQLWSAARSPVMLGHWRTGWLPFGIVCGWSDAQAVCWRLAVWP